MRKRNKFVAVLSLAAISTLISSTVFAADGDIYNIENKGEIVKQYTSEEIAISKIYQKKVTLNSEMFGYECSGRVYTLDEVNEIYNNTRGNIDKTLERVKTTLKDILVVEDKNHMVIESVSEFNNSTIKVKFKNAVTENQAKEATITLIKDNKEYNAKAILKKGDMEAEFKFDKDLNESGKYIIKGTEISVELKEKNEGEIVKEILDTKNAVEFKQAIDKYKDKFQDSYVDNNCFEIKEAKKNEIKTIEDIQRKVIYENKVYISVVTSISFSSHNVNEIELYNAIKKAIEINMLTNVNLDTDYFYISYVNAAKNIKEHSDMETVDKIQKNIIDAGNELAVDNITKMVNSLFEKNDDKINENKLGENVNKKTIDNAKKMVNFLSDGDIKVQLTNLIKKAESLLINYEKASASINDINIEGKIGDEIGSKEIKITLNNDKFNEIKEKIDVSDWFKNLPKGLKATIKSKVEKDSKEATIVIGGTPTEPLSSAMEIEILAENLAGNTNVKVDENEDAKFEIKDLEETVLNAEQMTATTVIGTGDKITFTGLSVGDEVKVYDAEKEGQLLEGNFTEIKEGNAEFKFKNDLGIETKEVWVTVKSEAKKESKRVKITIVGEPSAKVQDVTIKGEINKDINQDIEITISNEKFVAMTKGEVIKWIKNFPNGLNATVKEDVKEDSDKITISVTGKVTETLEQVLEIKIPKDKVKGNDDITVIKNENAKIEINDPAQSKLKKEQMTATTVIGVGDKISFTGLSDGDCVKVYDAEEEGQLLKGDFSEIKDNKAEFIFTTDIGEDEKDVWVTVENKGKKESKRVKITMPSEITKLGKEQIKVEAIINKKDKLLFTGLLEGDDIKVYDAQNEGKQLEGTLSKIIQGKAQFEFKNDLGKDEKKVWVTVKNNDKKESKRVEVVIPSKKSTIDVTQIKPDILKNEDNKIVFDKLNPTDVVKAYDSKSGGNEIQGKLERNSQGKYEFTIININVNINIIHEVRIWITITSENKEESERVEVVIPAKKSILELSQMTPHTVIGQGDKISFTELHQGDVITVYDGANSNNKITGKLGEIVEGNADFTFVEDLGEEAKDVWVKLRRGGEESERIKVRMPAEPQPSASVNSITLKGNVNEQIKAMDVEIELYNDKFRELGASQVVTSWFEGLPQGLKATVKEIKDNNKIIISIEGTPKVASNKEINITIPKDVLGRGKDVKIYEAIKVNFYIKESDKSEGEKVTASINDITIDGRIGEKIASKEIKITLKNDKFNEIKEKTDVRSWFKNLPKGLTATIKSNVSKDSQEATILIEGTPTEALSSAMEIEISSENLVGNTNIKVNENENTKFEIEEAEKGEDEKINNKDESQENEKKNDEKQTSK